MRARRQKVTATSIDWASVIKYVIPFFSICVIVLLCNVTWFILITSEYCSGTNTGGNYIYRICYEIWYWLIFVVELSIFVLVSIYLIKRKSKIYYWYMFLAIFFLFLLVIHPMILSSSFFWAPFTTMQEIGYWFEISHILSRETVNLMANITKVNEWVFLTNTPALYFF